MSINPFFSVVISTKNRSELVLRAVQSVLNQLFFDFELIVVDNASTDDTEEVLSSISDNRFFYVKNETDRERCYARNRGIKLAKGEYICFLDSDDEYLSNHLQVLYENINNSSEKIALFYTNAFETYNFQNIQERLCPNLEGFGLFEYILTYTFNPARVAIHKSILDEFKFDEKIPGLEDLDLWLCIATKFPIKQIKERTVVYQLHDESYSISSPNRFEKELSLYKYVFSKPILTSFLPKTSKKRLLSMCHYKISMAMSTSFNPFIIHRHILVAFFLYPKGYNQNANKTMGVIFLYQIPILGFLLKKIRFILKNISRFY
jgi:glycosyltransferase involved in cell wall biosynthesis